MTFPFSHAGEIALICCGLICYACALMELLYGLTDNIRRNLTALSLSSVGGIAGILAILNREYVGTKYYAILLSISIITVPLPFILSNSLCLSFVNKINSINDKWNTYLFLKLTMIYMQVVFLYYLYIFYITE